MAVSDVRAELADIERRRLKALVDADVAVADELHADDFQLVTPSGATYTKDGYLGDISSGAIDYRVWEPHEIEVRVRGDAACLRYRSELEIVVAGRKIDLSRYWHTDYYERRDGRWRVVFSHATEVIGARP